MQAGVSWADSGLTAFEARVLIRCRATTHPSADIWRHLWAEKQYLQFLPTRGPLETETGAATAIKSGCRMMMNPLFKKVKRFGLAPLYSGRRVRTLARAFLPP
jgi:hypothetical protein